MFDLRFSFALTLAVLLMFPLSSCFISGQTKDLPTFTSPDGLYLVKLTGNGERPLIGRNFVEFEVLKNGKQFIGPEFLHSTGHMDLPFNLGYPAHRWVEPNIVQFQRAISYESEHPVIVTAKNVSSSHITFLKVFCTDKFLALDLVHGATIRLECVSPGGDFVDFFVEAVFKDGRRLNGGSSFPFKRGQAGIAYLITVGSDSIAISAISANH